MRERGAYTVDDGEEVDVPAELPGGGASLHRDGPESRLHAAEEALQRREPQLCRILLHDGAL